MIHHIPVLLDEVIELLDVNPKKEICLLMAKIENGDTGDIQKANSWSLRARNGSENNIWVCMFTKKSQNIWTSVPQGGYFNSLEWRQPYMLNDNFLDIYLKHILRPFYIFLYNRKI